MNRPEIERDNEGIDWRLLREKQRQHETRMNRDVQLLLTDDPAAATLQERVSLDSVATPAALSHSKIATGESASHPVTE